MTEAPTAAEASRLDGLYRAKARAEIADAEKHARPTGGVRGQGDVLAEVLLVKGEPGSDDLRTKRALSGDDGAAIGKALDALGLPKERYAFCTASADARPKRLERVRLLTEAIEPAAVVLLDAVAAADFAEAYEAPEPTPGALVTIGGRAVVATEDFEASLGDDAAKRRAWRQLQPLRPWAGYETGAP